MLAFASYDLVNYHASHVCVSIKLDSPHMRSTEGQYYVLFISFKYVICHLKITISNIVSNLVGHVLRVLGGWSGHSLTQSVLLLDDVK